MILPYFFQAPKKIPDYSNSGVCKRMQIPLGGTTQVLNARAGYPLFIADPNVKASLRGWLRPFPGEEPAFKWR